MSEFIQRMRKHKCFNALLNKMIGLSILYRNWKARPVIRRDGEEGLRLLKAAEKEPSRVWFCCVAKGRNMGDQALRYCIEQWIAKQYPDRKAVPILSYAFYDRTFRKQFQKTVTNSDIFIIQSGYCTHTKHHSLPAHRWIVKHFPHNRILILPQTVRFLTERDGRKTGKIYAAHQKLLFLARDSVSYATAKHYFGRTRVELFPDIVTTAIGKYSFSETREGVLICARNDWERRYSPEEINALREKFLQQNIPCAVTDNLSSLNPEELLERFPSEWQSYLRQIASHKVMITDRFHGVVFALIANTPVVVLASVDHKVKTSVEWFEGVYPNSYRVAASVDEAYALASELLKEGNISNSSYFEEAYYETLKDLFESL